MGKFCEPVTMAVSGFFLCIHENLEKQLSSCLPCCCGVSVQRAWSFVIVGFKIRIVAELRLVGLQRVYTGVTGA